MLIDFDFLEKFTLYGFQVIIGLLKKAVVFKIKLRSFDFDENSQSYQILKKKTRRCPTKNSKG